MGSNTLQSLPPPPPINSSRKLSGGEPMTSGSHWAETGVRLALRLRSVATHLLLVLHGYHTGWRCSRQAENHAAESVLWSGEASHEGDQRKEAESNTEQVESPAKGECLEAHDGCHEYVRVLGGDDGTGSSSYSCAKKASVQFRYRQTGKFNAYL